MHDRSYALLPEILQRLGLFADRPAWGSHEMLRLSM